MGRVVSKNEVRGTASGVFFMAFFGTAWAGIGLGGLQGWGSNWVLPIVILIALALLVSCFTLMSGSRGLSKAVSEEGARQGKRIGIGFGITFGAEGFLIAIASIICNTTDHFEYFFPVMALIVGVHFFPLARLFRVNVHYVTGTLICLLGIVTFFIPELMHIGQHEIIASWAFLGFGTALILWGTGFTIFLMGRRLLRMAKV